MRITLPFLLVIMSSNAFAAETLTGDEIRKVLSGVTLEGESHGAPVQQVFQANGQTFELVNGSSSAGNWDVRDNRYCSVWPPNPSWSCYDVLLDGQTITFRADDGTLYPMKLPH